MKHATTVVIGAGQSGLAMSKHLSDRGIDHVVLDRGDVANSWAMERWGSLRLLTPNWQSRLSGFAYSGPDPDGYMSMPQIVGHLRRYASLIEAPLQKRTTVECLRRSGDGYLVSTDRGEWHCRALVLASGACNVPVVPALARGLAPSIASLTPFQYRDPAQLPDGGVMIVGASATGVQLARELRAAGRDVILCVGEHVRVPRVYRGRDILWWMDAIGMMDARYDEADDLDRARRLPSLQLIGTAERSTIDLNSLVGAGIEIVGKLVALDGRHAHFSGALANVCALADLKMKRLLGNIDTWIAAENVRPSVEEPQRFPSTRLQTAARLSLDFGSSGIKTVIWATGFKPDYSWLEVPVLDHKGRLCHTGGITTAPGMYAMGLPFMRRRKSSFIDGAGADAADLAGHLSQYLERRAT